jgi:hypothetical protein
MGSVCEFADNTEETRKIPPQMQMQASKLQSPIPKQKKQLNQQFLVINKDTGMFYKRELGRDFITSRCLATIWKNGSDIN